MLKQYGYATTLRAYAVAVVCILNLLNRGEY
jgi:hypothetical protein